MMDFTPTWFKLFVDIIAVLNKGGGTAGAVSATRQVLTTSPLTGGGNLTADRTISFGTQAANSVLAGPPSGPVAAPAFRSLQTADMPGISAVIVTAKLTVGGANGSMTFVNGVLTAQVAAT